MSEPLRLRNWAGNLQYKAHSLHEPSSLAEVQAIVRRCRQLRVLGSRHCFNAIADAEELLQFGFAAADVDAATQRVRVQGSLSYAQLCPLLQDAGMALHNLASLPHISVAGAVSTATHGAGQCNGNLATAVVGLKLVLASGEMLEVREGDAR
ncbi:unnamed protein product, partial [Effrenium voratum]